MSRLQVSPPEFVSALTALGCEPEQKRDGVFCLNFPKATGARDFLKLRK